MKEEYYGPRDMLKPEFLAPWYEGKAKAERTRHTLSQEMRLIWLEDAKRFDAAAKAIRAEAQLRKALQTARNQIVAHAINEIGADAAVRSVAYIDGILSGAVKP